MNRPFRLCLALSAALALFAVSASGATAIAPYNDNFDTPQPVMAVSPFFGNNIDSTVETSTDPTEPQRLQQLVGWGFANTVWHSFEAPANGDVTFAICADFPTNTLITKGDSIPELALATSSGGIAAKQTFLTGADGGSCSSIDYSAKLGPISVKQGDVLRPVVASAFSGITGWYFVYTTFTPAPANDNYADATPLRSRIPQTGSNVAATVESNESNNPYTNYRTVWYDYEGLSDATATIEVCADFPVNLVAYNDAGLGSLTPVAYTQGATSGTCGVDRYRAILNSAAVLDSHTWDDGYHSLKIQVGGYTSPTQTGNFDIEVRHNAAPANDVMMYSYILPPGGGTEYTDNTFATNNDGMVGNAFLDIGKTVFFHYQTYGASGEFTFDTCGSSINTVTQAFSINDFLPYAADSYADGGCPSGGGDQLKSYFAGPSNQGAIFQVGSSADGPGGAIVAHLTWDPAPSNNAFVAATSIGDGDELAGTVKGASTESGEPNNASGDKHRSVWYRFDAPGRGQFTFDTCDADFDSVVTAWRGSSVDSLTAISGGAADNGCDSGLGTKLANVRVRAGQTIYLQVDGSGAADRGDFTASLSFEAGPSNDDWADATDLGSVDTLNLDTTNRLATADFDPDAMQATGPDIGGQYRSSSVWFKWTAPRSDNFVFDTCDGEATGYDGWLAIYRKDPDGSVPPYYNLLAVDNNDDGCGGGSAYMPQLTLAATGGTTYWIAFAARTTGADNGIDFKLRILSSPKNTALPTLSGDDAFVGSELSATSGSWTSSKGPVDVGNHAWQRCDVEGENCSDISGVTTWQYTLTSEDIGSRIRFRVTASNSIGSTTVFSEPTEVIDADSDSDGIGDNDDVCPNNSAADSGKDNGCPVERIAFNSASTIEGDPWVDGDGLTVALGDTENDPGVDPDYDAPEATAIRWFHCESADDSDDCTDVTAPGASADDPYVVSEDDLGSYIRARIHWDNGDSETDEWTAARTIYKISPSLPSFSGTLQVGQTLTGDPGTADNQPTGGTAPSVLASQWWFCSSADDNDCEMGPAGNTLIVPLAALGKYIRFGVIWRNDNSSRSQDSAAGGPVITAPAPPDPDPITPTTPDPLNLSALKFPKKASAKKLVKAKGKFTIKSVQLACPAGGAACKFSLSLTTKIKKKSKKLGSSTLTIPAGSTKPLSGKLSSAGLKQLKKSKKLKATITVKGSGGASGKATLKEFNITK